MWFSIQPQHVSLQVDISTSSSGYSTCFWHVTSSLHSPTLDSMLVETRPQINQIFCWFNLKHYGLFILVNYSFWYYASGTILFLVVVSVRPSVTKNVWNALFSSPVTATTLKTSPTPRYSNHGYTLVSLFQASDMRIMVILVYQNLIFH